MKNALLCLLILGILTSSVMTSCGETKTDSDVDTETIPTVTDVEDSSVPESETEYDPGVPQVDYNGKTFTIMERADDASGWWGSIDVYTEETNGEPINDAVFDRNQAVNDYFNINIQPLTVEETSFKSTLQESAASSDNICDLAMLSLRTALSSSEVNLLYDLNQFEVFNKEAPYYTHSVFKDTSILNRNYFAVGDMTLIANEGTWALMFNKEVAEAQQIENLYELARNKQWTVDKFYGIIKDIGYDANGDSTMNENDFYGMITSSGTYEGLLYALDYKIVDKDENDSLVFRGMTERLTNAAEMIIQIMDDESVTFNYSKRNSDWEPAQYMFEEGHSLFYGEVLQCVTRLRNMDVDFGLLPWPMLDETQDTYKTCINSWASDALALPTIVSDAEMSANVFEYLSFQSMKYLKPAYFDKALTYKAMRDEESMEMLDYILDGRVVDIGHIADVGTVCSSLINQLNSGKYELSSFFQKKMKVAVKQLEKVMENYSSLE